MLGLALSAMRAVPPWLWLMAAVLAWGGLQRCQATAATKRAAAADQARAVASAAADAQRAARAAEAALNDRARRATDDAHRKTLAARAAAAAAGAELERLRGALSALPAASASAAASGPAAGGRADDAAGLRAVVGECAARLVEVAADADACGARLSGLQDYVRAVAPAPAAP